MASTSKDDNRYESGPGTERPGKVVGGKPTRKGGEVEPEDTGSVPLSGEASDIIKDEELIEMLEQLSDTIDTAQTILTDNQLLRPDEDPAMLRAAADVPPPKEQPLRAGRRTLSTATSLAIGISLGVGILAAFWLHASWPRQISGDQLAKDRLPAAASVVGREPDEKREPEAVAPEPKQPDEIATVPAVEAAVSEPKQPDEIAAIPALPTVSAPPQPTVDASSHERTAAETTSPHPPEPESDITEAAKPKAVDTAQAEKPPTSDSSPTKTEKSKAVDTVQTVKPPAPPPFDPGEEARLLEKGKGFSRSGDIASARLVYQHVADRGSAEAMYALAQTYDPRMLAQWKVIGITPEPTAALEWYTRAAALGHDAADARAHELEQQLKR